MTMYTTIHQFIEEWNQESGSTQKLMDTLTDNSLQQAVSQDDRTLGRIAWHMVTSTPEMLAAFGITVEEVNNSSTVPSSAKEITEACRKVSVDAMDAVRQQWTDESLGEVIDVFGMKLPKGATLSLLIKHLIHHRGQMTILMRQAGLKVPGVYGPAREEWDAMGMNAPLV